MPSYLRWGRNRNSIVEAAASGGLQDDDTKIGRFLHWLT
ncbi:hypothetical protein USDA257_c26020 [Sinorhizobium fredii USDA 257]|jgi:hypothetical protein|uniref:Uncharacterized protein n=1 Tax=Sinorhizobium fredii (strain USDA 257) TaxID=1185652 RepID=I3X5M1_SINF2|nr:hypothetical protein USDA257_c26020 [Sinorhizobium fredii USDA 257]